jgi:radical SAM-linked protein
MKYTQGFHPKPKLSFQDALPIGFESRCEVFKLSVDGRLNTEEIVKRLNRQLPEGLVVLDCYLTAPRSLQAKHTITTYRVELNQKGFEQSLLDRFMKQSERTITKKNRKGKETRIDLRQLVTGLTWLSPLLLQLDILGGTGPVLRPPEVVRELFPDIDANCLQQARIIKTAIRSAGTPGSAG